MAYIKGTWRWNDVIYCEYQAHSWNMVSFTSNETQFTGILGDWSVGFHYLYYCTGEQYKGERTLIGVSANELDDFFTIEEKYRIMDFGETEQEINDYLYDFIVSNAQPYLTIAEKLQLIAENEQKVYDAGKAVGKQAEYDAFWDNYIYDGLTNWQYVFYSPRWSDKNFYPNKDLKAKGACGFGFSSNYITDFKQRLIDCGVTLDTSGVTGGNYMFCFCPFLTRFPTISLVGLASDVKYMFADNVAMTEIEKIILKDDGSTTFGMWFQNCKALTTIAFEGTIGNDISFQYSTGLTQVSIESIINHLSDTTSDKTLTLSKKAVDTAFVFYWTDVNDVVNEVLGSAEDNPYWPQLRDSKPNWTITLV